MKRLELIALASTAAAALGCDGTGYVAVDQQAIRISPAQVSLGDSIPHGYDSDLFPPPNANVFNPTAYPWYLAQIEDIPLVNAACPGQTSGGFISTTGSDRDCFSFRETYDAMHVDYSGSQLEFAVGYLRENSRVRVITITLGADDVYLVFDRCLGDPACLMDQLPAVLQELAANMVTIYSALRAASSEPVPIIFASYYNPYAPDPMFDSVVQALNGTLMSVGGNFGVATADVYGAFAKASEPYGGSPCAAGLLQVHPDGTCSVHPSPAGARLIAQTIAPLVPAWTGTP